MNALLRIRLSALASIVFAALIIAALLVGGWASASQAADDHPGKARGHLYSTAAVERFCIQAQQTVAGTTLEPVNELKADFDSFVASDAAPYESPEGSLLPFTTAQLVTEGAYPDGQTFPRMISCKLKSAQALQFFYGAQAATPGATCQTVVAQTLADVFASLTEAEQAALVFTPDQVVVDPDQVAFSGPAWLAPFPPVIAYTAPDGLLHLRAKSLPVARIVPPFLEPLVPVQKRGVHYCHLPSPEFLRALVTGEVQP